MLARTLFWFFGHPLVYFWLLPAYVMYYVMLPAIAGGKLYSDDAGRLVFMLFIVLSAPVGLHHQFADPGIASSFKWLHGGLTFVVALPSFITAFTMFASLEYAARPRGGTGLFAWWRALPYFDPDRYLFAYLFTGLVLFFFGGITGIINASMSMNNVVHNTSWVPAHFHTTLGGPVFLTFLGMSVFLVTQLTGKPCDFRRSTWGFRICGRRESWCSPSASPSPGCSASRGARTSDPPMPTPPRRSIIPLGIWSHVGPLGGVIMALAMVFFFVVFFATLLGRRARAGVGATDLRGPPRRRRALVLDFRPWVIAAVVLLAIAYIPPIYEVVTGPTQVVPAYDPSSPVAPQR